MREAIEAEQVFVNTGARPFVPPIPGVDGPRVHVSETLLDVRTLPERLVVIGGGYIGMEFASLYANFGSQVTVVQDGEEFLITIDDEDELQDVYEHFAVLLFDDEDEE